VLTAGVGRGRRRQDWLREQGVEPDEYQAREHTRNAARDANMLAAMGVAVQTDVQLTPAQKAELEKVRTKSCTRRCVAGTASTARW
jgi:protein-tyrosine-phosphatase